MRKSPRIRSTAISFGPPAWGGPQAPQLRFQPRHFFSLLSVFTNGGLTDLTKINQVVTVAGLTPFDPFNAVPVEGVNYKKDAAFGGAIDRFSYTSPRTFRFSVGVKF